MVPPKRDVNVGVYKPHGKIVCLISTVNHRIQYISTKRYRTGAPSCTGWWLTYPSEKYARQLG